LKGCTARIVPNYSAFRKRNRFGNVTGALPLFEIARVLVRLDHVAPLYRKRESQHEVSSGFVARISQRFVEAPFFGHRLSRKLSGNTELAICCGSAYGSRTRVPALRGLCPNH
jgi:hypothetical protein